MPEPDSPTTVAPPREGQTNVAAPREGETNVAAPRETPTTVAPPREAPADEPRVLRDGEPVARRRRAGPLVEDDTLTAIHARARERFGGIRWGSAFFGLLSAIGLASILFGIVVAAGVAIGVSEIKNPVNGTSDKIHLGGAIAVLVGLAISWYCGGYVAGRMARFDGVRQGFAVWCWTILVGAAVAILAAIGGNEYNVYHQLNLPNIAVGDASLTTGGLITLLCAIVVTLVFALLGGKAGDIFHRRVDRLAAREYEVPA
jgi:hypothetical protein